YTTESTRSPREHISMLSFVRAESNRGPRPREMLEKVFAEVEDYRRQKFAWQTEFRATEMFLAGIGRRVSRRGLRVGDSRLKKLLTNTAQAIERRRLVLRDFSTSAQRSPLGVWERLWSQHSRAESVTREIELDTRLQVQSAKMFRTFLHKDEGVSLRTIARLVVLVYFVAGLASEKKEREEPDGRLWITDSQRVVTWRTVEDKLRRKRIR
ncbi:MAG: hypothetical protein WAR24_07915, partial [Candidatus Acidiferrales bacterium]